MIEWVFLDLDDTIYDFHKAETVAIKETLAHFSIEPTEKTVKRYSEINKMMWERLERGEATRDEVLIMRFTILFSELGLDIKGEVARVIYENNLKRTHFLMPGAMELLSALKGRYKLYLASNGTAHVQDGRIAAGDIAKYFDDIFISHKIGYNKPSIEYFNACFERIPGFKKERAIIVGDSLSSDILGGKNAGILTCRYNPNGKDGCENIIPDYEIRNLSELPELLEAIK